MATNQDQKMATLDMSMQQHHEGEKTADGLGNSLETDCPSNIRSFGDVVAWRKIDIVHVVLRLICIASSAMALSFMVTAHEASTLVLYGFQIPVQSEWSYSSSFQFSSHSTCRAGVTSWVTAFHLFLSGEFLHFPELFVTLYLVGAVAAVAAHSLLQLLISVSGMLRKSSVALSRNFGWFLFAADQVFAYTLISAGSAASGVTNLNRTGIKHTQLPNFCKPLQSFCDHVALSIAFTFLSCILLATSAVLDVIWLSN